ncbi:MAG TPA: ATP-binding protein [Candidatus Competibacter phosphatis]|nr:ATP-binding protein [Candidatus Competibacter phosphatis]
MTLDEQQSTLASITGNGQMAILRKVGEVILNDTMGWFMVWGGTGSAKTLFLQALTAAFCRRQKQAVYYHAADLCDGLYEDFDNPDRNNRDFYRRVDVLVIDELDKFRFTDWNRKEMQALLDHRYRRMKTHVTLFAANKDPNGEWLPDDIRSRMNDGRFRRVVDDQEIEGIYHIKSPDMRPKLRRK